MQGWCAPLLTGGSRCCWGLWSCPVGYPRALWGEEGRGWAGSPGCESFREPGGLQTSARPPASPNLGLPTSWAPHSGRLWLRHLGWMAAPRPRRGSEPVGPRTASPRSHRTGVSSMSQPGAAKQEASGCPRLCSGACSSEFISPLAQPLRCWPGALRVGGIHPKCRPLAWLCQAVV